MPVDKGANDVINRLQFRLVWQSLFSGPTATTAASGLFLSWMEQDLK